MSNDKIDSERARYLLLPLPPRELHSLRIDHDYVVTAVVVGAECGLVLPAEYGGNLSGEPACDLFKIVSVRYESK